MKKENLSGQSRDEILEMILEETARNPYKSNRNNKSNTVPRPVSHFKPSPEETEAAPETKSASMPKQQPAPINPDITQVFSAAEAEAEAARVEKDIMSEKIEAMRRKKMDGQKYNENGDQQPEERSSKEARTEVKIFPSKPSNAEAVDASEKIKELHREKAAAARAAIQQKAEIENARRAQQELDDGYDGYDDYDDDEKVNLFIPNEGEEEEEYEYETGDTLTALSCMFQVCISFLFLIYMVFTLVTPISNVSGESMEPTLSDGDILLTWSMGYSPSNGDLVIIDDKTAALMDDNGNVTENQGLNCRIVKRIIAMGGDTVDIDFEKGEVKVNGTVLNEDYISELTTRDSEAFEYPLTIPDGYAFVMGDNRNVSKDSRHPEVGLVPVDEIAGKVLLRFYPFDNFGTVE